jgi:hypothetical protein
VSAAKRSVSTAPAAPSRLIDVFLMEGADNRLAAIKAVASGALPIEAVSINIWKIRKWALDVNQPVGEIHGFKITERETDNGKKGKEGGDGGRNDDGRGAQEGRV